MNCKTGKRCYDKKGAQTARNKRAREGERNLRIYPCPFGNHFHLTHREFDYEKT